MNTSKLHKTGKWKVTLASLSNGIMHNNRFISFCQATVDKPATHFHIPTQTKQQHQLYPHTARTHGAKQPLQNKTDKTFIQEAIGVFLYYA